MNPVVIFRSHTEAVNYCRSHGYSITRQGLIYAIKTHPRIFVHTVIGTYYPKIYVDELDEYISLPNEKPTKDEITVKQAEKEYDISRNTLYLWIYRGIIPYRKLGRGLYRDWETDRKSTRLNSSHSAKSRMPSSA